MNSNLPPMAQIAKEAGDRILQMQADVVENRRWEMKEDGSPVTLADLEAHRMVCEGLRACFPGIAIVSEEGLPGENEAALRTEERFETDPLDNTTGYLHGRDVFSVNIGRIRNGVPISGVIYFPAIQELYFTGDDGRAYLQRGDLLPGRIQVSSGSLRSPLQVAWGFKERHVTHLNGRAYAGNAFPGQMRTCMVARGEYDVTGINRGAGGGFNSWDIAGPHAVLIAAGGEIVDLERRPIRYSQGSIKVPDHVAGANDVLVALGLADATVIRTGTPA
jgi:3'(2'), 5'-bisphosphate nucleotidase